VTVPLAPTALHWGTPSGELKFKQFDGSQLQVSGLMWSVSDMWGWHALLLPQMDASFMNINFKLPKGGQPNAPALRITVSTYVCPSANHSGAGIAYGDYRGSMGTSHTNGVLYRNSAVSDRLIKDGTSTTIVFGESPFGLWGDALSCCARVPTPSELAARPPFDWVSQQNTAGCPSGSGGCQDVITTNPINGDTSYLIFGFGSHHADVVMFTMADGSARPVKKSIDSNIIQSLVTRDGNERLSDDF
jgi:hypothetical protein